FMNIIKNEVDFRTIAMRFFRKLIEKNDTRVKEILKNEIIKRLKSTNLEDLRYFISYKDLDSFSEEELRLISFKPLEDNHFLDKCTRNHSLFNYVFSLLKGFIEKGFDNERKLLKSIFLRELDKQDSLLLKRLISGGYMEYLNESNKKEIIESLIKTGSLNVFLELDNRYYINLIDYQDDLLTPNTNLNKRLMEALENPKYIEKFGFRLLQWFAEKGTKGAQNFLNNQIIKWMKMGSPEILSFLKDKYQLQEYFQEKNIKPFIYDENSYFIANILKGIEHEFYSVRKNCFELFEISLPHLENNDKKSFINIFVQQTKFRGKKIPDTAFQAIKGLLMLGAFDEIRDFLISKGYYDEYELVPLKNQLRNFKPFPSSLRSYHDDYEEEGEYIYHTLQFLIFFLDSREIESHMAMNDEEFNALYKFIRKSGEFINSNYILNRFSKTLTSHLEDYLIEKLSTESNPQSYREILEFINYHIISLDNLKTKEFFFKVLNTYISFRKINEKYYLHEFFIDYIFKIRENLGDSFLDVLLKIFDEDFSILRSFINESLDPEYDISDEMREMAFKSLVLLVKSRNKNTLSILLKEQILISIDQDWLYNVFNELEEKDLEYFLFGLNELSKKEPQYYHYYEDIGDETYLINCLKETLNERLKQEKVNFLNVIIKNVILKYPDLFEFLVEAELFEDISTKEFFRLLKSSNNLFIKSILNYMKKYIWSNENFDNFYAQVDKNQFSLSFAQLIQGILEFFLDMLYHFDYEFHEISPHIKFFKKFGEDAFDLTFDKIKKWLNDEEYPHYRLFTWLINNDFLEVVDKDVCLKNLREISNELVAYLRDEFKSKSYQTGYNALALVRIYLHSEDENFIINLLQQLSLTLRENIKNSILNHIETNERKHNIYYKKLNSKLEATALKLVKLIEAKLDVKELKFVIIDDKKHYIINEKLNLSEKDIHDIEEIKGLNLLSELKELDLSENYITEIKGLDSLVSLESLNLDAALNEYKLVISEIKGLENLTNLKSLSLQSQKISEIKGLNNLISLERLMLNYNCITEIKNLENLKNLKVLSLEHNGISEIKGLEKLKNLNYLNLSNNQIIEINGLNHLKNLESLWLSQNKIKILRGLENLYNLQRISLDNQKIGMESQITLEKSRSYYDNNGPKYVVKCLKTTNQKIKGTINCPNPECDAIIYSVWKYCPICHKVIKIEKKDK
ncbi:MAG: leucine-rich repeat domain-containing protein, partial [Promethearchaeota archaeon]